MPTMVARKCANCRTGFKARAVDVKRGWGKYCSKSCKASEQEKRTHQNAKYQNRQYQNNTNYLNSGVSKSKYQDYQREYGGIPLFDRHGDYVGFACTGLSIDDHDPNKDL